MRTNTTINSTVMSSITTIVSGIISIVISIVTSASARVLSVGDSRGLWADSSNTSFEAKYGR